MAAPSAPWRTARHSLHSNRFTMWCPLLIHLQQERSFFTGRVRNRPSVGWNKENTTVTESKYFMRLRPIVPGRYTKDPCLMTHRLVTICARKKIWIFWALDRKIISKQTQYRKRNWLYIALYLVWPVDQLSLANSWSDSFSRGFRSFYGWLAKGKISIPVL